MHVRGKSRENRIPEDPTHMELGQHPLLNEIIKFVEHKLKLFVSDSREDSPSNVSICARILCACADGDLFLLRNIVDEISTTPLQRKQENGIAPFALRPFGILHLAAFSDNPAIVEFVLLNQSLIEKFTPIDAGLAAHVPPYTPHTDLQAIQPHSCPSSIHFYTHSSNGKALIESGVVNGATALHVAAARNNVLICRLLLACGSNVRSQRLHAQAGPNQKTEKNDAANRYATPLFDSLLGISVSFANHMGSRLGDDGAVDSFSDRFLTLPPVTRPEDALSLKELADATERESCLAHPFFATLALLINNGSDATLVSCPAQIFPPTHSEQKWHASVCRDANLRISCFLRKITELREARSPLLALPLLAKL